MSEIARALAVVIVASLGACTGSGSTVPAGASGQSGGGNSGAQGAPPGPGGSGGGAGVGGGAGGGGNAGSAALDGGVDGASGGGGAAGIAGASGGAAGAGGGGSAPIWMSLGVVPITAGSTADVVLPVLPPGGALVLRADAGADRCLQLVSWVIGGVDVLANTAFGPFCDNCEERSQVAVGPSLFVLPTASVSRAGPGSLRVGLRDCPTFGSTTDAASVALSVLVRPEIPVKGSLRLRPVRLGGSPFVASASDLAPLLAALSETFAPVGIDLSSEPPCDATTVSGDLAFVSGNHQSLGAAESASHASCPPILGTVPVLFGACLQETSVTGQTSELDGYTPHVVGGADGAVADAMFIKGALCGTPTPVPVAWAPAALARIVGHELGHYLGLFHSVEADGTVDLLPDTTSDNLMYYRPTVVVTPTFSPMQGAVMRRHPRVL